MYPRNKQLGMLFNFLVLHQGLYNAALQERIEAFKKLGKKINYNDQAKSLTEIRSFDEDFKSLNAQSCQNNLKKLDRAFDAFFQRCASGKTPGFPRFKSLDRFPGWGYNTHGDGWKMLGDGKVRISGVGTIRIRGKGRFEGIPKTAEVTRKAGKWYLSVTYVVTPENIKRDRKDHKLLSFDWGTENFLTTFDGSRFEEIQNPRFFGKIRDDLKGLQQSLATLKRGTRKHRQLKHKIAKLREYEANCRKDFQHKLSAKIVSECSEIVTESLDIKNMTKSATGTVEKPGTNVAQKSGLNREILSTAPRQFLMFLAYKAEEAGTKNIELNARKLKASQTCSECGRVEKKALSVRIHKCECGHETTRDRNAAMVMWNEAFNFYGLERPACDDRKVG